MSNYRWKSLSFALPKDVVDETVLMFVEDKDEPGFSITLAEDALPAGASLEAYVEGAAAEIREAATTVEEKGRRKLKVGGKDAIEVIQLIAVDDEGPSQQAQVFLPVAGGVAVITATAAPDRFGPARAALDALLAGLQIG